MGSVLMSDHTMHGKEGERDAQSTLFPPSPRTPSFSQEEDVPTIGTHPSPPMYFDYHGFPDETYKYTYPAPGPSAELRARIKALLADGGFPSVKENSQRGFGENQCQRRCVHDDILSS
jgi:hypothetical protein